MKRLDSKPEKNVVDQIAASEVSLQGYREQGRREGWSNCSHGENIPSTSHLHVALKPHRTQDPPCHVKINPTSHRKMYYRIRLMSYACGSYVISKLWEICFVVVPPIIV